MTANWKSCEVFPRRTAFPQPPAAGTIPLVVKAGGNHCPLCSTPDPLVILAGVQRCLMRCCGCGVFYLHPQPSKCELSALFREEYISTDEDVDVRFGTRMNKSHSEVARFVHKRKSRGRILDVGCAGGHFLDRHFEPSAWEKWGVDLSKFAAARAMSKAIYVQVGDIHSAVLPSASFDVVTVLDTFYYFPEPWRELDAIRRILKPDGLLVIVLPCADIHIWRNTGWISRVFSRSQTAILESHHLFFYNPKSMATVLGRSQFRISELWPLRALDQLGSLRNGLASVYSSVSSAVWRLSGSRVMLGPRFLVAATQ